MRYLIMVSHGEFANGLHNALGMMAGADRADILSVGLLDGMGVDKFREAFAELIGVIGADDEIVLVADIIGGSPLTTAVEVLTEKGLLGRTVAMGGMNLPLVLAVAFTDEDLALTDVANSAMEEACGQIKTFSVDAGSDDDI